MKSRGEAELVFEAAQVVMAGLSSDLLWRTDPTAWLIRDDLDSQQDLTMAAFVLLKAVIGDAVWALDTGLGAYMADLGLRLARKVEGLES